MDLLLRCYIGRRWYVNYALGNRAEAHEPYTDLLAAIRFMMYLRKMGRSAYITNF
jgi:hypothetical protein